MSHSRAADKFVVRLPDGMRERIADAAKDRHTSMNTLFVQAMGNLLDGTSPDAIAILDELRSIVDDLKKPSPIN